MPSYLLMNDTSVTNNIGCRGTVRGLRQMLHEAGYKESGSIPYGFGKDVFQPRSASKSQRRFQRLASRVFSFASPEPVSNRGSMVAGLYHQGIRSIRAELSDRLNKVTDLVINGEGTMHSDQPTALALVAATEIASELGVRSHLVNTTIGSMDDGILRTMAGSCQTIVVREAYSYDYLASKGIESTLSCDALFRQPAQSNMFGKRSKGQPCDGVAYTPGALASNGSIGDEEVRDALKRLMTKHGTVYFLLIENGDLAYKDLVAEESVNLVDLRKMPLNVVFTELSRYRVIYSGRYHVCIYSALACTPFVPLPTNTYKTKGLLRHLACERSESLESDPVEVTDDRLLALHELACRNVNFSSDS
ncbi:MAG: polysaccharide pyruvyl transferase family protein [Planctomycetota bacterium]